MLCVLQATELVIHAHPTAQPHVCEKSGAVTSGMVRETSDMLAVGDTAGGAATDAIVTVAQTRVEAQTFSKMNVQKRGQHSQRAK